MILLAAACINKRKRRRPTARLFGIVFAVVLVVARPETVTTEGFVHLVVPSVAGHCCNGISRSRGRHAIAKSRSFHQPIYASSEDNSSINSNSNNVVQDKQTTTTEETLALTVSPVDAVLSWITSDLGSIALGAIGLCLLLLGRLVLLDDDPVQNGSDLVVQTRVNLLAVLAIGAVLFNGLSELDVATALAEQVVLDGVVVKGDLATIFLSDELQNSKQEIAWTLDSVCAATPAATAILMMLTASDDHKNDQWRPVAFRGIVPPNLAVLSQDLKLPNETPILDRFRPPKTVSSTSNSQRQESYLPTLQALPGKTELVKYFLPSNTQAALLIPTSIYTNAGKQQAVLLLGSNQARSFTPQHLAWCQAVASRLEQTNNLKH